MTANKNKFTFKIKVLLVLILLILAGLKYSHKNSSIETPKQPDIIQKENPHTTSKCLPNESCEITQPIKALIKNTRVKPQKAKAFTLIHAHNCRIEIDDDSRLMVNNAIAQLNNDTPLQKYIYQVTPNLSLNILSQEVSQHFWNELNERLKVIMQLYDQEFSLQLTEHRNINLIVFPDRAKYLDVLSQLSIDGSNSQGLYWSASNFAFVEYKNQEQVIETSVHESIHTINNFMIGFSPRWLNEGLAEHFESIKINNNTYSFTPQKYTNEEYPLSLSTVISSHQQWDTDLRKSLYFSSPLHIDYLMAHKNEINVLSDLLNKEKLDPCNVLADNDYLKVIEDAIYLNFSIDFDHWYDELINQ